MEFDTTCVLTEEHRKAFDRLLAGDLSKEEYRNVLKQLPDWAKSISDDFSEHLFELGLEGEVTPGLDAGFAAVVTKAIISGRIEGRLTGLDNLPDRMAKLEQLAEIEMASEVAYIESVLKDDLPLPTLEIVRLCERALTDKYELLKKEFELQVRKRQRRDALGASDLELEYKLPERAMMLAEFCPLFDSAMAITQHAVWIQLAEFTRKQWALFFIETNPSGKKYKSNADAVKELIKPSARIIEQISGLSNIRGISMVEGSVSYSKDLKKAKEVVSMLKADAVMRKKNLLPLTES